jgi:hypothetical protein
MMTWLATLDEKVLAALIGGVAGLVVALLNQLLGPYGTKSVERLRATLQQTADVERARLQGQLAADAEHIRSRHQQELERYRQQLTDSTNVATARRDYEYEARKRLYTEVEPLLFRLHESLEEAHYRVRSLTRTAKAGHLGNGRDSWLRSDGYYLRSTIYKLILPVAHFRLMQRRVTFVDLNLDDSIGLRYKLMKIYVRSFTDDFEFARYPPALDYDPNASGETSRPQPRQALVLGDLENIADLLIVGSDGNARAMLFGEFESLLDRTPLDESLSELVTMFLRFSPQERPVLARLLVAQACLAHVILSTYHSTASGSELGERLRRFVESGDTVHQLGWVAGERMPEVLSVAYQYGSERLTWLDVAGGGPVQAS